EDQATHELRGEEGLGDVDPGQIEHPEPAEPEGAEHRGDDRGEHHLEHGEIREIELPCELLRAAHPGTLETPPERDPDGHGDEDGRTVAEEPELEERRVHVHSLRTRGATAYAAA